MSTLKEKAASGFIWSAIERFSVQGVNLLLGIFMARILSPSDFGIIGMLTIFFALSQSIIDSGFGNALIQKKDRNQTDYSTVFYFNIFVGFVLYFILFFLAPLIADFYVLPILSPITKVLAINLFINSLVIVQQVKLSVELNFRIQAKVNTFSALISGLVGIWLAVTGFGVWSLVYQSLLFNLFNLILLWILAKWKPSLCFSVDSFKSLFRYGSRLLVTGLYGPIYDNLNVLLIGKFYSSADLGFYSRASTLAQFPSSNITGIINRVSFPLLTELQDDDNRLLLAYRKLIRISSFIVFPLMLGLGAIAVPLIEILLTSKWLPSAPYLQLLCFSLIWYPICAFNINLLLVKGLSQTHLKLDILKKVVGIIVLFVTAVISIEAICVGFILSTLFSWYITANCAGRLIGLSFYQQLKDIMPSLLISAIVSCIVLFINNLNCNSYIILALDLTASIISYILLSYMFNRNDFYTVFNLLRRRK